MKDKHYHYLVSYFYPSTTIGFGCASYKVEKKISEKLLLSIVEDIKKQINSENIGVISFMKLECDCDE